MRSFIFAPLAMLALSFASNLVAAPDPLPLPRLNGFMVESFTNISAVKVVAGNIGTCTERLADKAKSELVSLDCELSDGSFLLDRANLSPMRVNLTKLSYIQFNTDSDDDIARTYYLRGTWNETINSIVVNSPLTIVVNVNARGEFSGFVRSADFNITTQLRLNVAP